MTSTRPMALMALRAVALIWVVFSLILGVAAGVCSAEDGALEQLVDIFEKKGLISSEEAQAVKEKLAAEQGRLIKKEEELRAKKEALDLREKALREREGALAGPRQRVLAQPEKPTRSSVPRAGQEDRIKDKEVVASPTEKKEEKKESGLPLKASFDRGFRITAEDPDLFSLRLGALLQTDYRAYGYDDFDANKNKFDIRRARFLMTGKLLRYFDYRFYYEFQGTSSRRLLDAYASVHVLPPYLTFRIGQGKEPFGLEQYSLDADIFFTERSMSFALTPARDVGLMGYGYAWNDRVRYWLGIFSGDGGDDATAGDVDCPEVTGRMVLQPFRDLDLPLLQGLVVGGSFSYARIGRNNVEIQAKTAGLTPFFTVSSNAKFNVIQKAGHRKRTGFELGWFYGPFMLTGEYIYNLYTDVTTSYDTFDIPIRSYYAALQWMITGEKPVIKHGVIQPIIPLSSVGEGGWGAFGVAIRYDVFDADPSVYEYLVYAGDSVRQAKAVTLALNWYLNRYVRLVIDGTRTRFDIPLKIYRDPVTNVSEYSDYEDVLTARLQLRF
jgi:phosphate-selective porin OprO/OprP